MNNLKIVTNNLNLTEVKKLIEFINDLKGIDHSVVISSLKQSEGLEIEFKEV